MSEARSSSRLVFADLVESLHNAELGLLFDRIISSQPRLLLVGETGTGKSSLVRHLFNKAIERGQIEDNRDSLVVLNMAAVPTELAESTLFGHVSGAFTSALQPRRGAFEDAQGGVLFLDEIHHAPPTVQRKLLVALQDREYCRLGEPSTRRRKIATWIIAGTTQPERIEAELRHRLGDFILQLKPLRHRSRAFSALVESLLERITRERWPQRMQGRSIELVPAEAVEWLERQSWPGNIRELESVLRTASFFVAEPGSGIRFDQLKKAHSMRRLGSVAAGRETSENDTELPINEERVASDDPPGVTWQHRLAESVQQLQASRQQLPTLEAWRHQVARTYRDAFQTKAAAARALGIDIKTFNKLLGNKGLAQE